MQSTIDAIHQQVNQLLPFSTWLSHAAICLNLAKQCGSASSLQQTTMNYSLPGNAATG
jgi:hypothetical protein